MPTTAPAAPVPTVAESTAVAPFFSPIRPDNRPTPLPGDTNGEIPARDLVSVGPNCVAARAAAPSLGLLFATARDEGVVLGAKECYRPLAGQVAAQRRVTAQGNSACAAPVVTSPSGAAKGTSMHGWGKATDFSDVGGTVTFGSPGDRYLNARAARFGWNHPAFALPGGSACPEAWHWEWVGDGGARHLSPIRADVVALLPSRDGQGYATVTGLGAVVHRGNAVDAGSAGGSLAWLVVAAARTPSGQGYWLASANGAVMAFGDAVAVGPIPPVPPATPVVAMAATPDGRGVWLATTDGHVFNLGSAGAYGSPASSSVRLARPVVAMAPTPSGHGYWVLSADGRVMAFGDAVLFGSASGRSAPVVAMAATPDGHGYWLAGADGSVSAHGDAPMLGSATGVKLAQPVVAMAATPDGHGYWLAAADGRIVKYGDAAYYGPG
ncbi:MAG: hypothetical protein JWO37_750 [Acidimicrobiales bacterium]|nr:hypothetical protein [Acidimicrobiales bacterium]